MYDYTVYIDNHLVGIHPENNTAIQFLDEIIGLDSFQFLGNTLWLDGRFVKTVIDELKSAGMTVHVYV